MDNGWFPNQIPYFDPFAIMNQFNPASVVNSSNVAPTMGAEMDTEMDEGEINESNGDANLLNQQVHDQSHSRIGLTDSAAEYDPTQPFMASHDAPTHNVQQALRPQIQRNSSTASDKTSTLNRAEELRAQLLARKSGTPSREKPNENANKTPLANNSQSQQKQGAMSERSKALDSDMDNLLEQGKQDAAAKAANSQGTVKLKKTDRKNETPSGEKTRPTTKPTPNRAENSTVQVKSSDNMGAQEQRKEQDVAEFDKIESFATRLGLQNNGQFKAPSASEHKRQPAPPIERRRSETKLNGSAATFTPSKDAKNTQTEFGGANQDSRATRDSGATNNKRSSDANNPVPQPRTRPEPLEPPGPPVRRDSHLSSGFPSSAIRTLSLDSDYEGLEDWLELTGFHDKAYRERTIRRSKQQKEFEAQKQELEAKLANIKREIHEDVDSGSYVMRKQSVQPELKSEDTSPKSMAPPPVPEKRRSSFDSHKPVATGNSVERQKRGQSPSWDIGTYDRSKQPRWDRPVEGPIGSSHAYGDRPASPRRAESARPSSSYYPNYQPRRSPSPRAGSSLERRISGPLNSRDDVLDRRDSAWFLNDNFRDSRSYDRYHRAEGSYSRPRAKNFRGLGIRYFLIKSWTPNNVQDAQKEGIWATQTSNTEMFTEAFQNSRHVILVFSVNGSKCFQGYARMLEFPGTAPTPHWVRKLNWETSAPFHIQWFSKTEVFFGHVGHITNSYNEDKSVIVGRDGQEIEPEAGEALIGHLDEAAQAADAASAGGEKTGSWR